MFDKKVLLGIIGSVIVFYANSSYIISILKNKTKPHLITWVIWTIASTTVFFAQILSNAGPGSWALGISCILMSVITIVTFLKKIKSTIAKSDVILFIVSILAIILWAMTSSPLYSVVILTTVDLLGYIPTIRKTYYHPGQEKISMYVLSSVRHLLSLASLNSFSVVNTIFQIGMIFGNGILIFIWILRKNHSKK